MTKRKNADSGKGLRAAYKKLTKMHKELKESYVELTFRMAMLAEYRDSTTGTHLVRIADYSTIIAEELGLPKEEIEILRNASAMHDIGKIMLPDSVLKKKGKLNFTEMALIRKHPEAGAEVFENAQTPLMKACHDIALTHHEYYNGSGYPHGLKGEDIPLYGRIVAVADVFDALTSKRSYKAEFSLKKTLGIIQEESGTHFDPKIVDAFLKGKGRVKNVLEANKDIESFIQDMGKEEEWALGGEDGQSKKA